MDQSTGLSILAIVFVLAGVHRVWLFHRSRIVLLLVSALIEFAAAASWFLTNTYWIMMAIWAFGAPIGWAAIHQYRTRDLSKPAA